MPSYRARRRWSLMILVLGLPAYIVLCVTLTNWIDRIFGRQPIWMEVPVYVGLAFAWAIPFRRVFQGIGQADPDAAKPPGDPPGP